MTRFTDWLLGLQGVPLYGLVGLVVLVEDALFVGFVVPGETAAVLGGVVASLGHASLPVMIGVVIACAVIGDSIGYEVGRWFGPRILRTRVVERRSARIDNARRLLARRGGTAVFFGRWVAFLRAVMPALAGIAGMRYRRFFAFNAAGGILWGAVVVLIGYLAGNSYAKVEQMFGRAAAIVVAALVVIAVVVWRVRRHTRPHSTGSDDIRDREDL